MSRELPPEDPKMPNARIWYEYEDNAVRSIVQNPKNWKQIRYIYEFCKNYGNVIKTCPSAQIINDITSFAKNIVFGCQCIHILMIFANFFEYYITISRQLTNWN